MFENSRMFDNLGNYLFGAPETTSHEVLYVVGRPPMDAREVEAYVAEEVCPCDMGLFGPCLRAVGHDLPTCDDPNEETLRNLWRETTDALANGHFVWGMPSESLIYRMKVGAA